MSHISQEVFLKCQLSYPRIFTAWFFCRGMFFLNKQTRGRLCSASARMKILPESDLDVLVMFSNNNDYY